VGRGKNKSPEVRFPIQEIPGRESSLYHRKFWVQKARSSKRKKERPAPYSLSERELIFLHIIKGGNHKKKRRELGTLIIKPEEQSLDAQEGKDGPLISECISLPGKAAGKKV